MKKKIKQNLNHTTMKKSMLTICILASFLFVATQLLSSCGNKKQQSIEEGHDHARMDSTAMTYACPMHPEVTGKEGGKCSKCGMKLEAVKNTDSTKHEH